ncbi:hypothetical protein ABVT39_012317 [Epinephelus coioides]
MLSVRLLLLTRSTQKQISKPETCGLVKSALAKQFPLVFISAWSENSVTSLSVFSSHGKHFDSILSLRLLFLTKSTQKQISKPETCGLVKSALAKQFPLVFISAWSENSVTSLSVFSQPKNHFDSMLSVRLLFLTKSTQKQISKTETCGLVKSALSKQFPLVFISAWSENSVTSLSVFARPEKHFDSMFSLRLLFLTKSTQKQISKPETCGLVKSALAKQFPLVFISAWSENSVTSLSVFSSHGKHFDIMLSLRLLLLTRSTQKQISKPETCGLVKSALSKQFPLVFISTWSENSVTSLSVFARPEKHFDSMLSLRLLFLTKSTQKQISKPETCGLVKSALSKQFPLVFISAWSENSVTSLSVFSSHGKHFDIMFSLRLLLLTRSTQKQISKPETCGLVKSALSKQFPLVFISACVFKPEKHFDSMLSLRLLFLTRSTQKQISKPETCGLVKSALAKQFPLVFISAWSENSVTSLSVFSSHGKHFDIMFSLRLLFLTKSTQKQISKPETCGLVKSALSKQFPLVFISAWSENSVTSLSVFARPEKHFDSMLSLRLLLLTRSTQKQISKPETCGLVKSALAKQFPLVFISAWSENSVTSLSVFSSHGKHFDSMLSLRLLFLTKSTQKQISKPETCGLVKSALAKQFPLVFISAWSENSVTSLSVFSSPKHFDSMLSLRLLLLTRSTQKQISKPETCGLVKSALSKQFPLVFISAWSENSVTSLSVFASHEKHFDSMLSLRLLFLTKSTQKQISKPETCGLVKSALSKQFPLVFISAWSENSPGKHFDSMLSLRLLLLTRSTQKQISKPETCGLVKSALSKQFPLVFISAWSENSVTSLSVFSSHGKHFDIIFSLRLLLLTRSTQKQISKPETCGLVKSALAKQFPRVFISAWSENSVTSLSVFSSHGKHFDIMFSLRLLLLTRSTQKQISKPETCGLVKSALSKQFPLVFISTWSENSVTSLSVFARPEKHFDSMLSLRLLFLTKSTQKQISKPETCGLVKSALSKQFPLVFISTWSENSVTSLSVFARPEKHFDSMFSLRLLFLTKSTQKQISKPETCGLVKSALAKQFPLVFISAWSENSVTSLSVFSQPKNHFDSMLSVRLLLLTRSTQKQISKPETCGLVKSALAKQFPLVFISAWSENSVTSLSVFSSHGKHFDSILSLRLLFLTKSTQKQISKPETCGLVKSALAKQFPLVFISAWSENSVTSLSVFSQPKNHFDSMLSVRLLFLTKSTQKQISKPETCGLVKSALSKQFPLVFISAWSENSVTSLSVFARPEKHFDSMLSLRLLLLTRSTQKQISKPETCGLVKSALAKQFPLVFISAWSENSVTSLSVFSQPKNLFDSMLSVRLLLLTRSTQKQISKPETCGLVKSALSKQFPLVFISTWSENSVTSLSVFARPEKHFDSMLSLRLLFLTKCTQKQISKPETCGLVKSALSKQFPLVFISTWSENSVTSLSVFARPEKHFDSMLSLRLLFLTRSTQKQISKPETCGLVKSALAKQFPLVFISAWSENSVTSLSVFSSHGKHFDIMFSLRLLLLTRSTQKQISKPETCGLVKSALAKQFPLVFISACVCKPEKHFDSMLSLRLLFLTKSTQKQISKPETCGLVKSALAKQFPLVFISAWSENSVTSLSVFSSHGKHFDIMFSLRLLLLTRSTQKQISKPETCGLVKSALAKQFPLVFISAWSENSVTSLSVFARPEKHFDSMLSLRLLLLTRSTQKQISKPETCGLVKSALAKQFPLVFISAWSENSVTSLSVFSSHGKHFDIMFSLRLLLLTRSTQKQISKPETCGLVKSALSKQFPLVFISTWSENSVTSLSVFARPEKHFDSMLSLRLLFLTKSTQKQISKPETCGLVKSALAKQFPLVFISAWSENSVTSLSVFSSHGKHFDIMFSLRLLLLTRSTQKQISKPETCGLVKSALSKQFPLVFISTWSENSVTSLSVFARPEKHFDSMLSLRLLLLTRSTQKQISKPETCGLVKSALAKQFPLVFISAWSENSVTSLSVFSSHGKHFDIMFSLRLLLLTRSTQKQISKPETCGLVKSALAKQFPLVFISAWSENSVTSLSVFSQPKNHFDSMLSLRLLLLTRSTQKQISKPETCGLVKSALAKQFPLVFISAWSENSVTSLSVISSHGKHFDIMFSLRLLFLTKSTQKQISKPETCGLVKSALAKQFPLVFISAWSENSVTSLSVFSSHGKHFDIMFSLRLLLLTRSTQKQISKPETCGLVKSALSKQFPLVFISTWSENSVTSLSVFARPEKHFDSMFSHRLLLLTKSTQKQISKPETCGLVKSALSKQFPLIFISTWSENSVTSLSVFARPEKHFDSMLSLRLLFLTKSTQKQISKPETCGLVKSALAKQFPLVFISAWSENSVTSLSVFSSHGKHFDIMFSLRLLLLTRSTQKQISKPETCGLVKSALSKQFPLVFISTWSENSVTSLSVFARPEKHFDSMLSLRLLLLTRSTQKQISKPETCGLVKSALAKQFPLVFISAWSENSVTSLSVFSSHGKHFDIMFSLRLLLLTRSTQKQISKPETCGLVKSALAKQFPLVFISAWSENSVTSLSVFARPEKHFDSMLSVRLLLLTRSTQKQISKPETCGLVKSALAKQFPLGFISAWSENSVTSLSVFSSHGKHFDIMFSLRLLLLTRSTQKQISKPETCGLVKSALAKQFPLVFISAWSENSVTSLSVLLFLTKSTQKQISKPETCGLVKSALAKQFPLVFISAWSENSVTSLSVISSHGKHFDIMFSLRLLFLTKSTQKQISKPETCGLVKSALAKQFPLVFISAWSENSVTHGKHFDIMFSLRLLLLTRSTQKQISKPETCGLVKSALSKQFPLVFISTWSENSVTSLSVFARPEKHFDSMFSLRLLLLTKSTQKQISKPETCGLVKSALSKQFPLIFISTWSENSVTSLSVFARPEKHFDSMLSLRLLFLTKSTQKQISKPETCGLVKSALSKQFPLVFISTWSENSVTSLSVFARPEKHFDSMLSLRLLLLTRSTQKQISKPETCGLVKSALSKQFPLVFISTWSENSVTSLSVFARPEKHFDSMLSLRLLFLTKSTQKQISKPETCGLVKSALAKQFPLVFISAWSENSVTSLSVFSSNGKHFDIMFSLRLLLLTRSTQKQISKPETCGLVKSALSKQFPLVFISAWSENSVTSLSVFARPEKHFDSMLSLRLLFLTKSTQKQISKPETCGLVKSALSKQFPLVFISAWSENSVTSLSVFARPEKHFDSMLSLRLLFLTKSTQKQISKPETCGLVKSALAKQFPLVFISAWSENSVTSLSVFSSPKTILTACCQSTQKQISKPETCGLVKSALAKQFPLVFISACSENSVTSLSVFSSHGKHFDIMFSLRLLLLTRSTQKQISKPETCGLVKSALAKQFPLVFISAWSENSVTSLSVFARPEKHFDSMLSLRLLLLTRSTQKQISKPETCGLVKSALAKQFPLVFISAWSENSVTSLSVFSSHGKHFDSMLSLRLLFLTKSTQKQISKPETCGLVKSALAKQFPLVFISAWSENSVTSLSVMLSLRLLLLTRSTQKQISKPETCGLVKSALAKQFPLVFISAWSENSVTSLSVISSHGKHFDIMFSLRLLLLTRSTQKQISKPETCGLVKSALSKQFPLVFISTWSENSVTSLSVFARPEKHFDSMLSLRLLFLTKSTQKQISKPETCGLVKSALAKQFPLVFISAWSENSVTSLSVFSSHGKHFDIMLSLRLLFLTKSTQKQISKPETCGLVKSALAKQFPLVFISAWSENSVTSLSVFSSHGKHFDIMFSLRLLLLTRSTQKQISKPETCGLVKSALAKQFPLVFISAWSENSVTSLSVFSSHGKHFDIMFSLRLLLLTRSTQKQISKPETCGLVKSALSKQFPLVFISTWSENSVTSLSVFARPEKHFDSMLSLRLLLLTRSTQKQISKPETCGLVKSALSKQFPLVFISTWSENSVTSLSVFARPEKHFDSMLSLRLLFLTKSTQKQISKPETCGLVKSALAKQFPLVFISAWSENSVTSRSVFSSNGKHFDIMLSLRLLLLTRSTQKQISKPETCGLVKSALAKQFPLVFISTWSENSVTSLSVFPRPEKHFDSMLSLRLLFLTKSTQKQISKPETCGLVKSALSKQFPLVFISTWSENSVTSLSVFARPEKHFDSMLSLRLLFLTKSTQKQISKPETCGLVKSALAKQFPLVFISAWSENSVTSLSVFSQPKNHFDSMLSVRLLLLTRSTQKQISKPETCGLVKSALAKQFPLVFISAWSENSVTSLSVISSHGKHFDIMFSLRLLLLTRSTQKQISKPETCGLVKSALSKQFPLVFISTWSENSVTSLSVFARPEKHFDSMLSLRLLFLTKSTQKQISKPETCGLVKSALAKQFPLVFISAWSENSVTSLSVFSSHGKHFDIMFSLRLLFLTKSTQKQISKPETCGLVKSALAKQFPLVFISAWSENSVTSLSVFSSHGKHFDIMFSLRLLLLTRSTQKQISKPETCGLVKSALSKPFPLVFISTWSENSVTSLSVFARPEKHFDSMLSLRLLFLTKSTQKQISKPETCGLVKSALAKQFPLVFISAWSENSVTSLSVFSSHGKHFDSMLSLRLLLLTRSTQKQISKPETCGLVKSALAKQFPLVFISAWSENSPGKHFDSMLSLRLLFLTKSTQKQISKPETCGLVKSALAKQFPLVFISAWSENSVTSLSVFSQPKNHFDSMLSVRLLLLTRSTQKQISKPETCGLVKSALAKQFPLVFISAWSENSVTSLSVFARPEKHFDSMLSLRLLLLTRSTQKQISKPETCGLVKSALAKQFPLVFISAWSENSVTSLSVFSSHGKHFDIMFSLRLLRLTKSTQKQISKPETCGLVKSALSKQFPLVFISTWSENSVTSLSVFARPEKHFDSMLSLRLLFLTKSTQKQISKPETCGLVKSALSKQFPLVFISAWSENSVTSLSVFSSHGKQFDSMLSLRLLFLTKSTQKQISKPETCGLVKSALAKQFPLVFISAWSENSVTSLSVFSQPKNHFDSMLSVRLLLLTRSTQKQISKPETCGLVKSALSKQFPLVFISAWSEHSVTSLSVFARLEKHFDSMLSVRLLLLTRSTQKQISKPETCGLVKSALAKQFPLVFISAWSENSVTSLSVFSQPKKLFDSMLSVRLLLLTRSTQKQISKPETCGLVKSALSKQFPLVFISTWSENSVTSLSVFARPEKHFDSMLSLRLLFLTKSTQKQISKPETCGLVKSALSKQFPLVFISTWSENSVTSLSVFARPEKHFDSILSLRLLFLTKSTQKQISKPETCGLVKSALAKQFPLVFISAWSENSVTSLSVFSSHGKHFDIMFSLRLLLLTRSTQKQISKPETCGLVKSALAKQFHLVFISAWSENSVTSLSVFSQPKHHFDSMLSVRLLLLTRSTQKQISKPETCGLVKSALSKQFPLVFISAWSENSVTSLSVFARPEKHFDSMLSLRLLLLTRSTQKQISKPETCGLGKSALSKQFPLVFISTWSENSVTSLSVFARPEKHFDSMFSLRLLLLTKSTQKQISKPETCGLVKSALAKQFPLVFISAWSENSVTSLSVFARPEKHFDSMLSLRLLLLTKSTQKQISKPETCGLVKSALAKQFPLVFISAWSENSVTSLSVFSSNGKHFDIMFSLRLLLLTRSTQKQISKPETCGLVKSALSKQFPLVFISTWSENSVTSLSVFARPEKHFDSMLSLRLLFLTKSTQKQISKPETCGLVKSALSKQFPLVFISAWSENSVTSLSVFSSHGKQFDSMLSLRLLFLTKSTQKQISKPETCGLVKSALAKQFPLVFISAWSENSVTSLSVFSQPKNHFDIMLSVRLLLLTRSTQKQISKPETCGLVKSAVSKQFPLVFISACSENSVTSLSVFARLEKHFDSMLSVRLLFLTKSTQKQISKPETCGLVKSALSKQFPLVFISTWSENSVTSLSVFARPEKHFDSMLSLRLLFLTKSTQKQISKPETCGLVKSALAKQFPLVFISAWSENSVTSLSVFSQPKNHFDSMLSVRLLLLTRSTQKQISKPETCGLVKSALAKQFPLVFISACSENSVTSLSVFSSHGKHFDIMFSLRLLLLTRSTQKQISKPETCGLVKSALSKQFPLVFISAWSENSVTSLSVFARPEKHFDSMLSLRLLLLTRSTQKQDFKPETCGLVKSALSKQFPLVFISTWSENSVTSLSVFARPEKHFDSMLSLRLLFLTKSTQKQISKPETCGLVKSALSKQFPLVFISTWSENSVTSLSVFARPEKHFDSMLSLRLLFLTKSTQKQISKPETCGLVKSALAKQFPLVFISAWSENSVTSLSVFSQPKNHFDSMLSVRLLLLTRSTQKQISKPETCGLVKSALAKQFPLVFISAWSENSVTSLSVFSSHGKHFDIMFSLRLLLLTRSTQKQISKPETCGLVKSALAKQFPLVFISAWSENSVTSLSVFARPEKHFDSMLSLRLLLLTRSTQKQISKPETSTQKQISKPETCGLVKSALAKQFPLVFISAWSENSVTSLSVFSQPKNHFDSMLSLRLLLLTRSTQKQISKPETCGLVKSALAKQFPLVFISAWSENSVTSLSVFSSHGKHFDIMFSLRLLLLTRSTQKQISKPETCGLVKSALSKQFPLVFISTWSENSVTSLSVFARPEKHFDSMLSLRLLFLTKSTQKQISKPETCGLVKSALAKQFPLVFISAWSENSVTSLSVFSSPKTF